MGAGAFLGWIPALAIRGTGSNDPSPGRRNLIDTIDYDDTDTENGYASGVRGDVFTAQEWV